MLSTDCLEVIDSMKNESRPVYSSVLKEIKLRKEAFQEVSCIHEKRSSNVHAHDLAHSSLDLLHGRRRLWLLQSPDTSIIPMHIE